MMSKLTAPEQKLLSQLKVSGNPFVPREGRTRKRFMATLESLQTKVALRFDPATWELEILEPDSE